MKKILGVLSVVVIAVTMFLCTNNVNGFNSNHSLADLIDVNMNIANAESEGNEGAFDRQTRDKTFRCGVITWTKTEFVNSSGQIVGTYFIEGGVIKSTFTGSYSSTIQTSGSTGGTNMTGQECPSGWWFCTVTDPCKEL